MHVSLHLHLVLRVVVILRVGVLRIGLLIGRIWRVIHVLRILGILRLGIAAAERERKIEAALFRRAAA